MSDSMGVHSIGARRNRVIPGGVNSAQRLVSGLHDLVIAQTEGKTFTDLQGRVYTDYHAAFGPPLLGHNDPEVDRAVAETARTVDLMGVGVTGLEIELADRLVEHFPSMEKVLLASTGSEATFHALRLARAVTSRRKIIKFQGCYHGWHDSVAMNVISAADRVGARDPLSTGILPEVLEATTVLPFNDATAVERELEANGDDVAAVIIEPIPHNIGTVLPLPGYLERLRELCTQYGVILVFDEVVTGFRHGLGGYQSVAGVIPDLTAVGKAIANGYPIAAIGGRSDLMDEFNTLPGRPVFFGGTFNGHPAMAAAALATIARLEREPVHEHIFAIGDQVRKGLRELYDQIGVPAVVTGFGSVFVTYFMEPPVTTFDDLLRNDADLFTGYRLELMKHGVFELPLNLKRSHISLCHDEQDVRELLEATEKAVTTVLGRREREDGT
jgi:glutamate-1-semialdehyde 2,1-aminomutase